MQMVWSNAKPGSKLKLSFTSDKERVVNAKIIFSKAQNYARYKIGINDSRQATIDGNSNAFGVDSVTIKNVRLLKGENELMVTLLPSGSKENIVGVDCVLFD